MCCTRKNSEPCPRSYTAVEHIFRTVDRMLCTDHESSTLLHLMALLGHLRGIPQEANHLSRSKGGIDDKEKSLVKGRLAHRAVVVGRRFFLARWDHSWALKFQQERMDVTKRGRKMFQMGEQFGPGVDYDLPLALVNKALLGPRQPGPCLLLPFHGGVE